MTIAYHKFSGSLGIIFVDCDDDERNVSQFTSLFFCPDPILLDSWRGTFDIFRRSHKFGNSDRWRLWVKRAPLLAPPTLFIEVTPPLPLFVLCDVNPSMLHLLALVVSECYTWMFFQRELVVEKDGLSVSWL